MTKQERKDRGLARVDRSADAAGDAAPDGSSQHGDSSPGRGGAEANRQATCTALSYLFLRDDGWLRAKPDQDAQTIWLKWKFTHGRWAGHYVMVSVKVWNWDLGVQKLRDKCDQVDLGMYRPTFDTPYLKD